MGGRDEEDKFADAAADDVRCLGDRDLNEEEDTLELLLGFLMMIMN
jgi:hypothetical protein